MDKRVTLPKRVTSPSWGPPPPCKQTLIYMYEAVPRLLLKERRRYEIISM